MRDKQLRRVVRSYFLGLGLVYVGAPIAHAQTSAATESMFSWRANPLVMERAQSLHGIDAPSHALASACNRLGTQQFRASATDLRDAAQIIDREAKFSHDNSNVRLARNAALLRVIAREVESGKLTDCTLFRTQLSHVLVDLASHLYAKAAEAWAKKEYAVAQADLAGATRYVHRGLVALGESSTTEQSETESEGNRYSQGGRDVVADAFHSARHIVSDDIEKLRNAIKDYENDQRVKYRFNNGV